MGVRITVETGTRAGQEKEFSDELGTIIIGRDPARCQIVLDEPMVGREHCALKRELGRYLVETNAENPVFFNGRILPHDVDNELPRSAELQIGRGGPTLAVTRTSSASHLPSTIGPEERRSVYEWTQRNRRLAYGTLSAIILLGLVGRYWTEAQRAELHAKNTIVEKTLAGTNLRLSTLAKEQISTAQKLEVVDGASQENLRRKVRSAFPSVYLVLLKDAEGHFEPSATAWVVGDGMLATNGHVAEMFEGLPEGVELIVRSNTHLGAQPRDHRVTRVLIHPGYKQFDSMTETLSPKRLGFHGVAEDLQFVTSCDVALMWVEDATALAPALRLASDEALRFVQSGDGVGFVGFPMEEMAAGGVNAARPTPTLQLGHVTAVTDPFLAGTNAGAATLLQHNLPSTGGASGSPILNSAGEIVGILSAGNTIVRVRPGERMNAIVRAPNAVQVNFAQRADLLRELMTGAFEQEQPKRFAAWREALKQFEIKRPDTLLIEYYDRFDEASSNEVETLDQVALKFQSDKQVDLLFNAPFTGVYQFLAVSDDYENIDLQLRDMEGVIVDEDRADDFYPVVERRLREGERLTVRIVGPEVGIHFQRRILGARVTLDESDSTGIAEVSSLSDIVDEWVKDVWPAEALVLLSETRDLEPTETEQGGSLGVAIELPHPGWYLFGAEAGSGTDIDLAIISADGEVVALDEAVDGVPIASIGFPEVGHVRMQVTGPSPGTQVRLEVRAAKGACHSRGEMDLTIFTDDDTIGTRLLTGLRTSGFSRVRVQKEPNDFANVKWGCASPELIDEICEVVREEIGSVPVRSLGFSPGDRSIFVNAPSAAVRAATEQPPGASISVRQTGIDLVQPYADSQGDRFVDGNGRVDFTQDETDTRFNNPELFYAIAEKMGAETNGQERTTTDFGYFVRTGYVTAEYLIGGRGPSDGIQAFIERYRHPDSSSASQLAEKISAVTACFGIDPEVFAALVRKESGFRDRAVSPTGAKGLTQMTSIGVDEVNDQLGKRGPAHADPQNTTYFSKVIQACIEEQLLGGDSYVQLWKRPGLSSREKMKEEMLDDPNTALIYGAILLKTLLAHCKQTLITKSVFQQYQCALMAYNGDKKDDTYVKYAKAILEWQASI